MPQSDLQSADPGVNTSLTSYGQTRCFSWCFSIWLTLVMHLLTNGCTINFWYDIYTPNKFILLLWQTWQIKNVFYFVTTGVIHFHCFFSVQWTSALWFSHRSSGTLCATYSKHYSNYNRKLLAVIQNSIVCVYFVNNNWDFWAAYDQIM